MIERNSTQAIVEDAINKVIDTRGCSRLIATGTLLHILKQEYERISKSLERS